MVRTHVSRFPCGKWSFVLEEVVLFYLGVGLLICGFAHQTTQLHAVVRGGNAGSLTECCSCLYAHGVLTASSGCTSAAPEEDDAWVVCAHPDRAEAGALLYSPTEKTAYSLPTPPPTLPPTPSTTPRSLKGHSRSLKVRTCLARSKTASGGEAIRFQISCFK